MNSSSEKRPNLALIMLWLCLVGVVIGQVGKGISLNSQEKPLWLFFVVSIIALALYSWIATLCYRAVRWASILFLLNFIVGVMLLILWVFVWPVNMQPSLFQIIESVVAMVPNAYLSIHGLKVSSQQRQRDET